MSEIIKAVVTESNNEISCSIEETNRVRALLGLKPLRVDTPKVDEAINNFKNEQDAFEKQRRSDEMRERLEKAKRKRLLNSKLSGTTLGDIVSDASNNEESLLSASDWVERSRIKTIEIEAERNRRLQDDSLKISQADSQAVVKSGMKIKHAADTFIKDLEMSDSMDVDSGIILTLADAPVLIRDAHGNMVENDTEEDVLENVNLLEADLRKERERKAKRMKQPIYGGYDDEEFEELNGDPVHSGRKILSQYDVDDESKKRMERNALVIGAQGEVRMAPNKGGDTARSEHGKEASPWAEFDDEPVEKARVELNLHVAKKEIAGFYTNAEYEATQTRFNKPKKKTKRVKKTRVKHEDEEEDGEGGLDSLLPITENSNSNSNDDRGSRAHASNSDKGNSMLSAGAVRTGKDTYARAVDMAQAKNMRTFANHNTTIVVKPPGDTSAVPDFQDVLVDEDTMRSLERAKRIAARKAVITTSDDDAGAQHAQAQINTERKRDPSSMEISADQREIGTNAAALEIEEIGPDGRRKEDGRLVFNETTEFAALLRARLNEKARLKAEVAIRDQERAEESEEEHASKRAKTDSDETMELESMVGVVDYEAQINAYLQQQKQQLNGTAGVETETTNNEAGNSSNSNVSDDDQMGFIREQPAATTGLAAALKLLKATNGLNAKEEVYGRANDKRDSERPEPQAISNDKKFNINIEYRDKAGRLLTKKDAYRQLCYDFHGYGPSKMKLEKKAQQIEKVEKSKSSDAAVLKSMNNLTKTQSATGKAFVTIQVCS